MKILVQMELISLEAPVLIVQKTVKVASKMFVLIVKAVSSSMKVPVFLTALTE